MAEQSGFQVGQGFYPLPEKFRIGDPSLVESITGLSWNEFTDRLDPDEPDPIVLSGMLAVAVWQANPRWTRDRVQRFVEGIAIDDVTFVGAEEEDAPAQDPPSEVPVSGVLSTPESNGPAASPSEALPSPTGDLGSDTTSTSALPT